MLYVIEGKSISCVDVSKKFLISFLETPGEELVRDGGTCQGVQEEDFGPGIGAAVR
jgi:hypothetical protein